MYHDNLERLQAAIDALEALGIDVELEDQHAWTRARLPGERVNRVMLWYDEHGSWIGLNRAHAGPIGVLPHVGAAEHQVNYEAVGFIRVKYQAPPQQDGAGWIAIFQQVLDPNLERGII